MKKILKGILKYVLSFIILLGVYFVLMTLSSLIPSNTLEKHVRESSETLVKEGEKVTYNLGYKEENIFTFTDALMINTAYSVDSRAPIKSFILARKNYIPGQTEEVYMDKQYNLGANKNYINPDNGDLYQTKELYGLMHGEDIKDSYEYARYWHGYLVVLRPLLFLFNYEGIRIVLFILTLVAVISMIILICKKINIMSGIVYGIGLLSINIFIVTRSINEILIFLVAFISSIVLLLLKNKIKNMGIFFFIVGSVSSFIDLFTAPLVTLGFTAITYFLILQKDEEDVTIKKYILELLKVGISWALGYGITWVSKWIIVQLIYNRPIITQAIEQMMFRSDVPQYKGMDLFTPLDVIKRNLDYLSSPVIMTLVVITSIYIIVMLIKNFKNEINIKQNLKNCIPYALIFLLPLVWYVVIKQHSYTHVNFTYRLLVISIICVLIIATTVFSNKEPVKKIEDKSEIKDNKAKTEN